MAKKKLKKAKPAKKVKELKRAALQGQAELAEHQQAILEHEDKRQTKKAEAAEPTTPTPPVVVSDEDLKAAEEKAEAATQAHADEVKRLAKMGLVEIVVKGTPYTLVGMKEPDKAPPTTAQRLEMAKRLNAVGPLLPRYIGTVGHLIDEHRPHASTQAVVDVAQSIASGVEVSKQLNKEKSKMSDKKVKGSKAAKPEKAAAAKPEKKTPAATTTKKDKALSVPKVPAGGFKKESAPATSGELIRARITEHKLTDEEIAKEVVKLFPGRSTKVSDVRWNRGQMRKRGVDAPDPVGEAKQEKKGKK